MTWQQAWRDGILPQITLCDLRSLEYALANDDHRLIQGATTISYTGPIKKACLLGWIAWHRGFNTASGVECWLRTVTAEAKHLTGIGDGVDCFIEWFDSTPRAVVFATMLAEVRENIAKREAQLPQVLAALAAARRGDPPCITSTIVMRTMATASVFTTHRRPRR